MHLEEDEMEDDDEDDVKYFLRYSFNFGLIHVEFEGEMRGMIPENCAVFMCLI